MLILTYLLNSIDYLFTLYWVRKFGIEIEGNPIGRWMFSHNIAWLFKIVVNGGLLAVLYVCIRKRPKLAWMAYIPIVAYIITALYHIAFFLL